MAVTILVELEVPLAPGVTLAVAYWLQGPVLHFDAAVAWAVEDEEVVQQLKIHLKRSFDMLV